MKKRLLFPLSLAASVLLCGLPCFFTKIFYMYGDDYLLNYIVNGSCGDEFRAQLVYIKYPLGLLLGSAFRIQSSVNWYALLLIGTLALSFAVIHYCILLTSSHPAAIAVSLLCNAAAVPLFLTFTVTAFLSACAGFALVLTAIRLGKPYRYLLFGMLFMVLSFLIRSDCLVVVGGIAFPSYVLLLRDKEKRLEIVKRVLTVALPLSAVLLVLMGVEKAAYSSPEWAAYIEYNDARGDYLDYPGVSYDTFAAEYGAVGFTQEEWLMLNRWTFCEKNAFSVEKLRAVSDITRKAYTKRYRLQYLTDSVTSAPNPALLLLPLLLLGLFLLTDPSFKRITGCGTLLMLYLVLAALAVVRLRFLLRVSVPLVMCAVVFLGLSSHSLSRKALRLLFLAVFTAVSVFVLQRFYKGYLTAVSSIRNTNVAGSYNKLLKEMDKHPERVYAVESPIYIYLFSWGHTIDEVVPTDVFSHIVRAGSWDNFSPRYYKFAEESGISDPDNLLSSLADTEGLYFVTENPDYLMNFLNAEYDEDYEIAASKKKGAAKIIRITKEPAPDTQPAS